MFAWRVVRAALIVNVSSCLLTYTRANADGTAEVDAEEVEASLHVRATGPLEEGALPGETAGQGITRRNDALCAYWVYAVIRVSQIYAEIGALSQQWWNPWAPIAIYYKFLELGYWQDQVHRYAWACL